MYKQIILCCLVLVNLYCNGVEGYLQSNRTVLVNQGQYMSYLEYLPPTYSESGGAKSPVIIFLHGAGEVGGTVDTLQKLKNAYGSPPYMIDKNTWPQSYPFIVLSPQIWGWWSCHFVHMLTKSVATKYPGADTSRIYLTGLSMGGAGVVDTIRINKTVTDYYAAAIAICPAQQPGGTDYVAPVSSGLPILFFHNNGDPQVSITNSQNWNNTLNDNNICPKTNLTVYTATSHDAWTKTYDPSSSFNVWNWFLQWTNVRPSGCGQPNTPEPTPTVTSPPQTTTSTTTTSPPSTTDTQSEIEGSKDNMSSAITLSSSISAILLLISLVIIF
ncbi:hypothetical protein DLAC_09628 [Tieghemostelium lacteum]|uniref:Phospholipase/carboxylesterase/thioesterase domain-containing protein n=1 Tax=Tieghemostelium lacteum TaxID=361077 RepID=A0A151Z6S4_TIELA|nr:hypothetical protein DLAC_09628 [Tieghemostelium lacteum]|eukprot:KYQ89663.1 hypothetical protein DLAC_09628 [Tieghemostelium lacteum]